MFFDIEIRQVPYENLQIANIASKKSLIAVNLREIKAKKEFQYYIFKKLNSLQIFFILFPSVIFILNNEYFDKYQKFLFILQNYADF